MNLHIINVIIGREYMTRVKKKSFLLTTFLGPVFFAAMCILPSVIMFMTTDKGKEVAVIDRSGIVMPYMTSNETTTYTDYTGMPVDSAKAVCNELGLDALVVVSPLDSVNRTVTVDAYSGKPMSMDMKESISARVNEAVEEYRLESYRIEGLKQIIEDVKADVSVSTFTLDDSGEEKITSSEVYMIISLVLSIIIYMFIAMFSAMVMQSVIEEKSSRVVEVLVSSVKATELMFGKIIGVACVALTQFFLWVVLTAVLVVAFGSFVGFDAITESANVQTEQMAQMTEGMGVDPAALDATGMNMQVTMPEEGSNEMAAVIETVKDINYPLILVSFVVYFVLGYLLYASLFAAIGSAVENEADTQQLQLPVTIPLLLAFFIAFYAFKSPDSQVVFWGSIIPFTSPIVMLARIPFGVPAWELALSIVLLVLTFMLIAYLSAKIYKIGILMFGKKTSFKDLYKWLKQK
ncbi:MAG: ABC transporter permease [Bacteroidetes bacterium]|uniref:ABC transporter permease n=1 Tax=Candidatus Cryptobacteroides avicola TaxID=2840757 RepID=A0A940DT64_9BACT|nr:ABC transporter permease [Candidatus Cryptobacteroides avicola]